MKWKNIDTCPVGETVDIYVRSIKNPNYGRRACNVSLDGPLPFGQLLGYNPPKAEYGEYASHWMPLPKEPPKWK